MLRNASASPPAAGHRVDGGGHGVQVPVRDRQCVNDPVPVQAASAVVGVLVVGLDAEPAGPDVLFLHPLPSELVDHRLGRACSPVSGCGHRWFGDLDAHADDGDVGHGFHAAFGPDLHGSQLCDGDGPAVRGSRRRSRAAAGSRQHGDEHRSDRREYTGHIGYDSSP